MLKFVSHSVRAFSKEIDLKNASLKQILRSQIKEKGPLTFPSYWHQALLHEKFGYYMKQDVFNKEGDFVTSVEISQLFNEILAIWLVHTFQHIGVLDQDLRPRQKMHIMEFGPGLGTLSCSIFRIFKQFNLIDQLQYTYIEMSDYMRKKQQQNVTKLLNQFDVNLKYEFDEKKNSKMELFTSPEVTLRWFKMYEHFLFEDFGGFTLKGDVSQLKKPPVLVIAHEFFDALPVHIFEYHLNEWYERLVGLDDKENLRFELRKTQNVQKILNPEKQFSEKIKASLSEGDTIEVCPQGQIIANSLAELIAKIKGAALIVDYGEKRAFSNSVRAIARHKILDEYLNKPGECDLSAYVNFLALEQAALQAEGVRVPELMTQAQWLEQMGIQTRLQVLCNNASKNVEKRLQSEYERLVSSKQMGQNFKFMCIQNASHGHIFPFVADAQQIYY